jgi:hypothetical protein
MARTYYIWIEMIWFERRFGQTKDYKIVYIYYFPAKYTSLGSKSKDGSELE